MRLYKGGLRLGAFALLLSMTAIVPLSAHADEDIYRIQGDDSPIAVTNQAWGRLEYFNGREYDGKTSRAKDNGPRVSIGASRSYNRDDLTFTPRVTAMAGYTNYQGTLGAPYNVFVDTYDKSFGFGVGADVGAVYHFGGDTTIEPFAGLGWDWWRRDTASWGGPRESWDSIYARGGARGSADLKLGQTGFRGYGELGLKMPLSTQNSIKLAGHGKATLKPGGALSAFAEAGVMRNRWRFGLSYDSWRFLNSDPVKLPDGTAIIQRKSQADILSLTVGYAF